jgi:[protein-PII] uridylyltransferase
MKLDRGPLLADRTSTGGQWCARYSRLVDGWLAGLFDAAGPPASGLALVAVGGYGRSELCPASDIDVMLVHAKSRQVARMAEAMWYPIWDEGLKLGHSVCTVSEALRLAGDDLDTATSLLSCRLVAGDPTLVAELAERAEGQWRRGARRWLDELARRVEIRHHTAGEVAFLLEPDLKESRGGLRDVHALTWAEAARSVLFAPDRQSIDAAYDVLLAARVELHRATGRALNVLTQEDQAQVAAALGDPSSDVLMQRIVEAATVIAWTSDDTWRRVESTLEGPPRRGTVGVHALAPGVIERDREIHGDDDALDRGGLMLVLRIAVASAEKDLPIDRVTLDRLGRAPLDVPAVWPAEARQLFERLLFAGRPTIGVVEALDHTGIWQKLLPEWTYVRSRPQRNPYHRYTVDRHLLEAVANASELASTVDRPDLLVTAALLHDLGKGRGRDHTELGIELAEIVATRLGYPPEDVDLLCRLVRHHLLLGDVASRRDLDDDATIELVAVAVGSVGFLQLLAALTEADARATGPAAWGPWRAELVQTLVARVTARLRGEPSPLTPPPEWPTGHELADLEAGGRRILAENGIVTVATADRTGVLSRVAGVLALRGLDVLEAVAYSTPDGLAASRFRVVDRWRDDTPWDQIVGDIERALDGRLAVDARLADRARQHARRRSHAPSEPTRVRFDNSASNDATVVDIEAADSVGLLYRITRALSDLDLDIRSARVQTLGVHVVDAFYVRDRLRRKVVDPDVLAEVERAVLHAVTGGTGFAGA